MKKLMIVVVVSFFFIVLAQSIFDISNFGAVPHSDSVPDQIKNQKAIILAFKAANSSKLDRAVRIPEKTFYSFPIRIQNISNISWTILGKLSASKDLKNWIRQPEQPDYYQDFISFHNCRNITLNGGGMIDGRGYHWWMLLFLNDKRFLSNQNARPHLIHMINCDFVSIHDLKLKNSPQFHIKMDNCHDVQIYNLNIKVNITAQFNLAKRFSVEGSIIMFPFNTDGIDPSGARMHIHNLNVQNYDDVVVPKPQGEVDCTRDMLIENCTVVLGVGMTVGSVPPEINVNCVRNITFRNIDMKRPLKGIYVKSNPGENGTGIVQNILYENFTMDRPIWWAVYIGPQQMKEPDGDGPGCMLYPFDKKGTCATQPRVTFDNITLKDISIHKPFLYPYTIRCNASNPCTNINFYSVRTDEWQHGQVDRGYVCQFVMGKGRNNFPKIHCLDDQNINDAEKDESQNQKNSNIDMNPLAIAKDFNAKTISLINLQLERAMLEIGYESEDDEFDYDMACLKSRDQSIEYSDQ